MNKTTNKFAPEVRGRAVRMVLNHEGDQPSAIGRGNIHRGEDRLRATLDEWLKKTEDDSGKRARVPTEVADELMALECENRELRQAMRSCASLS